MIMSISGTVILTNHKICIFFLSLIYLFWTNDAVVSSSLSKFAQQVSNILYSSW